MFVAATMILANVREQTQRTGPYIKSDRMTLGYCLDADKKTAEQWSAYGFPYLVVWRQKCIEVDTGKVIHDHFKYPSLYSMSALNLAISLAILFVVWLICEWFIHRRATLTTV